MTGKVRLSSPPTGRTSQAGSHVGRRGSSAERVFLDAAALWGPEDSWMCIHVLPFLDGPHGKLLLSEPWFSHLYNGLPRTCPHLEGHFCSVKPSGLANGSSGARVPDACSCTPLLCFHQSSSSGGWQLGPFLFTPDGPWGSLGIHCWGN